MEPLDVESFRAPTTRPLPSSAPTRKRSRRRKAGEWFVKGPIPGEWIGRAAKLPGKALHVGLAVWYLFGLTKRLPVALSRRVLALFGVLPDAGRRALTQLEGEGLVSVDRHSGRCSRVTIVELPKENE